MEQKRRNRTQSPPPQTNYAAKLAQYRLQYGLPVQIGHKDSSYYYLTMNATQLKVVVDSNDNNLGMW